MEKFDVKYPIIVEGKYDKIKVLSVCNATVMTTEGFGIFKNSEKLALLKKMSSKSKIIVLTDSDGAGKVIRSHITSAIPKDRLVQLYIPQVKGKESRKEKRSAEGFLGVEGTVSDTVRNLLLPYSTEASEDREKVGGITKTDFYEKRLSGREDSSFLRDKLAKKLDLPEKMTANSLLAALNVLISREEFEELTENLI